MNPEWKADTDMIRSIIGRQLQKKRHVPLPQLPLQISSLLLALPCLQ